MPRVALDLEHKDDLASSSPTVGGNAGPSHRAAGQLSRVASTIARSWSTAWGISLAMSRLSSGGCSRA